MIRLMVIKNHRDAYSGKFREACKILENNPDTESVVTMAKSLQRDIDDQLGSDVDIFKGLRPDKVGEYFYIETESEAVFTRDELWMIREAIETELRREHPDTPLDKMFDYMKLHSKICLEENVRYEKSQTIKRAVIDSYERIINEGNMTDEAKAVKT